MVMPVQPRRENKHREIEVRYIHQGEPGYERHEVAHAAARRYWVVSSKCDLSCQDLATRIDTGCLRVYPLLSILGIHHVRQVELHNSHVVADEVECSSGLVESFERVLFKSSEAQWSPETGWHLLGRTDKISVDVTGDMPSLFAAS
jgi:hypothetical protein